MVHVFKALLSLAIGLTCLQSNAQVIQERFKRIPVTEMTPLQKQYFEALMSGPVSGTGSAAGVQGATSAGAPFTVYMGLPVLASQFARTTE